MLILNFVSIHVINMTDHMMIFKDAWLIKPPEFLLPPKGIVLKLSLDTYVKTLTSTLIFSTCMEKLHANSI